ncbi:MAG: DUF503 domain-containing protein [Bryobacter sp.]|jgi:uncharacterized protein YlxP (DUF503 family)|nr:DUF503 domain-containing protein [Bryobacter sp. CoA8 C33]
MATVGTLVLELHLPEARSLKDKRHWVTGLKDRLRHHHNVAVAEIEFQDVLTRSLIAVVTVSNGRAHCQQMLEAAERSAADFLGPLLTNAYLDYF